MSGGPAPRRKIDELRGPVEWLLGPDLLGKLRRIVLGTVFSRDLDLRDWMQATSKSYVDAAGRHHVLDAAASPPADAPPGEVWFDFIADTGDSQLAMYGVACLLFQDLAVAPDAAPGAPIARADEHAGHLRLPRGHFLVIGGDTAYHVADVATLEERVLTPMRWALADLGLADAPRRPAFAIPGNHDYYDQLVGFNRLFRVLADPRAEIKERTPDLPGFERAQHGSYFRVHLPWGWELWGLDPGHNRVDVRQAMYFRAGAARADKRILCTPSPAVVHERVVADEVHLGSLARVDVPAPFLAWGSPPALAELDAPPARDLAAGACQLDLSGDVHHYARYGGGDATHDDAAYASVVAGLGGAFHHPSYTGFGEVPRRQAFPRPDESRRAVARRLVDPTTVLRGGFVRVIAALLALVVFAGSLGGTTAAVLAPALEGLGRPNPPGVTGDGDALGPALVLLGAVGAMALLATLGVLYWKYVARQLARPRASRAALVRALSEAWGLRALGGTVFAPAFALFYAALALPYVSQRLWPAHAFDVVFVVVVAGVALGLVALAYLGGGAYRRRGERARAIPLGVLHAAIQLTVPLALLRATPLAAGAALGVLAVTSLVARAAYPRAPRLALPLWIVQWGLVLACVRHVEPGAVPLPDGWERVAYYVVAAAVGMVVSCHQFGWYLLAASAWNGHNNEAGATARIDDYQQIIRFRVTPGRITGWVIGLVRPGKGDGTFGPADLSPTLIDTFWVEPRR